MINAKIEHCTSLEEFYGEIRSQQEEAHGHDYCYHHDAIVKYMRRCTSYKELGTHQGATAAAACLSNPKKVELVDIDMDKFEVSRHLFEDYCASNDIELVVKEMSSIDRNSISECDVMLIDTIHNPNYLSQELQLHLDTVTSHIVFHDTSVINRRANESLYHVAEGLTKGITPWIIAERYTNNVGYTVISNTVTGK